MGFRLGKKDNDNKHNHIQNKEEIGHLHQVTTLFEQD